MEGKLSQLSVIFFSKEKVWDGVEGGFAFNSLFNVDCTVLFKYINSKEMAFIVKVHFYVRCRPNHI